jgi:hypothetical protein
MAVQGWSWDSSLYAGSARFYPVGRVAYPPELAERLAHALSRDWCGTCSPTVARWCTSARRPTRAWTQTSSYPFRDRPATRSAP